MIFVYEDLILNFSFTFYERIKQFFHGFSLSLYCPNKVVTHCGFVSSFKREFFFKRKLKSNLHFSLLFNLIFLLI